MTDAPTQAEAPPAPRATRPLAAGAAVALLTAAAFWWTFRWMMVRWDQPGGYYSHGWLVPVISLGLLWLRRRDLAATPVRPCNWGLLVLVPSLLLHLLGTAWQVGFLSGFALLGTLAGLVLTLLGPAMLRACLFPMAFLAFMVPLPVVLIETLSFKLKLLAAGAAAALVSFGGLAAVREGSYIRIPAGTIIVDDVCSGLKYLISLTAFGAVYASMSRLRWVLRVALFSLAIPIAFVANMARVTLMVLVAHFVNIEATEAWYFHDFFGFALFAMAFLMLFLAESVLLQVFGSPASASEGGEDEGAAPAACPAARAAEPPKGRPRLRSAALTGVVVCGLALVAAAAAYLSWPRSAPPPAAVWEGIPMDLGQWQGHDLTLSEREYELLGTRDVLSRDYRNGRADQVQLIIVLAQQMRRRSHPPVQCLTGEGYVLKAVGERSLTVPDGKGQRELEVRELVLERAQDCRIAWYFFKSGPSLSTSYWRHQTGVALRKLTDPDAADVLVRLDVSVPSRQLEHGRALLRDLLTQAAGPLLAHLP